MKRLVPLLPWLAVAYFIVANIGYCAQREDASAEAARLRATVDSLAAVTARVDTVYARDTLRLWRTLTHYDSIRTTDTLTRNDTVFVPRVVADEAVASCRATVLTCEQRVAVRDSTIRVMRSLDSTTAVEHGVELRKARRSRLLWGAAGLALGYLWPR